MKTSQLTRHDIYDALVAKVVGAKGLQTRQAKLGVDASPTLSVLLAEAHSELGA